VTDGITLTNSGGELVVGAANDTSNFFAAMKLTNNGTSTATSASSLGIVKLYSPLASAGLRGAIANADGAGNSSFSINGVAINYNVNTDSVSALLDRITQSGAGVAASYNTTGDRITLTNKTTGDTGIGLSETGAGFLAAAGLTTGAGGTFTHGKNALFTVNNGPTLISASNTLDASVHGVTGLSVTVDSQETQTVTIGSDTANMQGSIQAVLDKFNALQDLIDASTHVTVSAGKVSAAVLSNNREVDAWGTQLRSMAFDSVSGVTGSVQRLDDLGIDFDSTSGHLTIKTPDKLSTALANHPTDVQSFFLTANTGFVPKLYDYLTNVMGSDTSQQTNLSKANTDIDTQIAAIQTRLDNERTTLTNSFIAMLDAQSKAQSQTTYLTTTFFNNNNNNSCWVARAVYGPCNPRWLLFRHWLLERAPRWFRALYLRHGERFAAWLSDKPRLRAAIRRWMDSRIAHLAPAHFSL
jgi:flagellar hook-associated protein 2